MNAKEYFGWAATCLTAGFYVSLITPFFKIFKGKLSYEDAPIIVIIVSYINHLYFKSLIIHNSQSQLLFMVYIWKYDI